MKDDNLFSNLAKLGCLLLAVNAYKLWWPPRPAPVCPTPVQRLSTDWKFDQPLFPKTLPSDRPLSGLREFQPLFPARPLSHDLLKKWEPRTEPLPVFTSPSKRDSMGVVAERAQSSAARGKRIVNRQASLI